MSWKYEKRYPDDLDKIQKAGVKVYETPKAILEAQLKAWDIVIERLSKDAYFGKVIASQKAWAKRIAGFRKIYESPREIAYTHFFGKA